jgi:amidohydrolase
MSRAHRACERTRPTILAPPILAALALLAPLLAPAPPAAAQDLGASADATIAELTPSIVEIRHHIHQNPELSNRETETAALVAEHLRGLGLEVTTGIAHTGVEGVLTGGKPGPVVAVRADMDALPVTEQTDFPFASTKRTTFLGQEVGVAHACGHDIHTSVGLGVASTLAAMRDELPGTVVFVFQPAEEGPPPGEKGGASLMLEEGLFERFPKPEAIFALHAFSDFAVGEVGINPGATMASVDQFKVKIRGKQAHGAYPHLGIDPVVMASQAVMALQTIRSRNLPATAPSVVTVGIIRGGERFNIIPEEVHLEGTVRTYDEGVRQRIEARMREILDGVTKAGGGSFELDYVNNAPATINDDELTARARASLERTLGEDAVYTTEPTMGGEDFAYFAQQVPGVYFRLGVVAPGTESGAIHTPDFRASDDAVPVGMRAMTHLVLDFLRAGTAD